MLLIDYIDTKYFLISLGIGLFLTYISTPPPQIIYKYPTPDNSDELVYIDNANNCFKYKANEVKCPSNKKLIHNLPEQTIPEEGLN